MDCKKFENELAEQVLGAPGMKPVRTPEFAAHLEVCDGCTKEVLAMGRTMSLLDEWKAPQPSGYFDQKMAVLLREEQAKAPANWLERIRERLLFNTGRQFRPAMVGVFALVLLLGGGSFAGLTIFHHPDEVKASATVNDLQILDNNQQAIQQMDQLLQDDDASDPGDS